MSKIWTDGSHRVLIDDLGQIYLDEECCCKEEEEGDDPGDGQGDCVEAVLSIEAEELSRNPCVYRFTTTLDPQGCSVVGYSWDFGDGDVSDEVNPVHEYEQEGTFLACLTVELLCDQETVFCTACVRAGCGITPAADCLCCPDEAPARLSGFVVSFTAQNTSRPECENCELVSGTYIVPVLAGQPACSASAAYFLGGLITPCFNAVQHTLAISVTLSQISDPGACDIFLRISLDRGVGIGDFTAYQGSLTIPAQGSCRGITAEIDLIRGVLRASDPCDLRGIASIQTY